MSYHCQVEAARIRSWLLDMQAGYPSKAASTATIAGRGPVALQLPQGLTASPSCFFWKYVHLSSGSQAADRSSIE